MDEFDFRSDPITVYGVSCPWASENYTFTRFPLQFLFRYFSSPEPKAQGELIVWDSSLRLSVRATTLSNMNISETRWPIAIKFHQKHHWGKRLAALGFGRDRSRTLVSMATDSFHRVVMGKTL